MMNQPTHERAAAKAEPALRRQPCAGLFGRRGGRKPLECAADHASGG